MIFLGFRDSSPYMAADSNPTHDQKAMNRPMPAAPATAMVAPGWFRSGTVPDRLLKALSGLSELGDQPSGPPLMSTDTTMRLSMMTSVTRKMPSTAWARLIL